MSWTNQMAAVTGAGSGIGRAIAQMMAARGAAVAAIDLDIVTATETVARITQAGGRASSYQADVSQAAEIDRAITVATADLGLLHIMVNNAGILDGYFNVDETDEDLWPRPVDRPRAFAVCDTSASCARYRRRGAGSHRIVAFGGGSQRRTSALHVGVWGIL